MPQILHFSRDEGEYIAITEEDMTPAEIKAEYGWEPSNVVIVSVYSGPLQLLPLGTVFGPE